MPPLHAGDDEVGPRMPGERGIGDRRAVDVAGPTIERIFEECTLRWREGLLTLLHRARLGAVDAGVEVVVPLRHLVQLIAPDEQCSGEDFHRRIQAPLEGIIASDERAPGIVARQPVGEECRIDATVPDTDAHSHAPRRWGNGDVAVGPDVARGRLRLRDGAGVEQERGERQQRERLRHRGTRFRAGFADFADFAGFSVFADFPVFASAGAKHRHPSVMRMRRSRTVTASRRTSTAG